jgi:hypothetical protein
LRASYYQADVVIDAQALNPLFSALRGNGFANVVAAMDYNDPGSFLGLGAEINHGNWLVMSEFTKVQIDDSYYTDKSQFYITGGYRFGAWTPTLTYGTREGDAKTEILALLPNVAPLAPLRGAVNGVLFSDNLDAEYMSYGLRWDVATNVALKADFTQYENNGPTATQSDSFAVGVTFTF